MPSFAELLRQRIESDEALTEAGLAKLAGLDNSTIRRILAEGRNPRVDTAEKICAALGTTLEAFMGSAQTDEERDILRLAAQLPADLRQKLLVYAQGLADAARRTGD